MEPDAVTVLGLDIGGANLKAATADGCATSRPFALWQQPHALREHLTTLIHAFKPVDRLAVTMTAELCDCFTTKREGVAHVLNALPTDRPIGVWATTGRFVSVDEANAQPLHVAAGNWHALATFVARLYTHGTTLLIDMGSTTTDVIRLRDGHVAATGMTDTDRLANDELIYLGARRTPLMALSPTVEFQGRTYHVMAEWFATTADMHVLLGSIDESPNDTDTPDRRPMTKQYAAARMARMIGADMHSVDMPQMIELAACFAAMFDQRVRDVVTKHTQRASIDRIVLSGSGAHIARQMIGSMCPCVWLGDTIGQSAADAACAYALTQL